MKRAPGNVMLTKHDAKLLDFGPARVGAPMPGASGLTALAPTFLVLKDAPDDAQSIRQLEVVLNWQEDLRRLTEPAK